MHNKVILDLSNNSAYISLNGITHLFTSVSNFIELSSFPFNDVVSVSYEPSRNIKVVERLNGIFEGEASAVIVWIEQNLENLMNAAKADGWGTLPPGPSLRDIRQMKLIETDWLVLRHKEEIDLEKNTTLTLEQYHQVLNYRQALRDITKHYSSNDDVVWPILDI